MKDWEKYLLRYREDYEQFRKENEALIKSRALAYKNWINSLPYTDWIALRFRDETEARLVIGIICVLYWEKEINITFSNDMRCIRRGPCTDEEVEEWLKSFGLKK